MITKYHNALYATSKRITTNTDDLKQNLKKSINELFNILEDYLEKGWYGTHFINILMKKMMIL